MMNTPASPSTLVVSALVLALCVPVSHAADVVSAEINVTAQQLIVIYDGPVNNSATQAGNYSVNHGVTVGDGGALSAGDTIATLPLEGLSVGDSGFEVTVSGVSGVANTTRAGILTVTETFDLTRGIFDQSERNRSDGNDFGFSPTTNAGGVSGVGELGGKIQRRNSETAAWVATEALGGTINSGEQDVIIRGKMRFVNSNFDGSLWMAYIDDLANIAANNGGDTLGLNWAEPNGDTRPAFRGFLRSGGEGTDFFPYPNDTEIAFHIHWDSEERILTGRFNDDEQIFEPGGEGVELSAFVIGSFGVGSFDDRSTDWYVDDLTITVNTVPEPRASNLTVALGTPQGEDTIQVGGQSAVLEGSRITLDALAGGGEISSLELLVSTDGGAQETIGELTSEPFVFSWNSVPVGNHVFVARGTTPNGDTVDSSEVGPLLAVQLRSGTEEKSESFRSDLGSFNLEVNNQDAGNDFGFTPSNEAGGSAGEVGGFIARNQGAYVGTDGLGGLLSPTFHNLRLQGKITVFDNNFDGDLFVGYIHTESPNQRLGVNLAEPRDPGIFRGTIRTPGANQGGIAVEEGIQHEFDLTWNAESQTFTGSFAGVDVNIEAESPRMTFNAVIIGTLSNSNNEIQQAEIFVDDLTYSVATGDPIVITPPAGGGAAGGGAISIGLSGGQVTITWEGNLESADSVTGPWTAVSGDSPLTVAPEGSARFYRALGD